ncbi:DUF2290 domain-containing protein [Candidatus Saccharibacteria bacterium]|nr:DUF2290 domain-containing protein [Candidatus Saccharibacteria bacterium]
MPSPNATRTQIEEIVLYMMDTGLSDDQNFPHLDSRASPLVRVSFPGAEYIGDALRDRPYEEIYRDLAESRAFNLKMLDGALVQMTYQFVQGGLVEHRLAFLPSPSLAEFQNDPQVYFDDDLYADIVASSIVHVPMRFDYDASEEIHRILIHPKSHLTLGQYRNCRIPVSAPLTPLQFTDFILRNFYHTAYQNFAAKLPVTSARFPDSILPAERELVHIVVPR